MLKCEEFVLVVSDYLDGKLPWNEQMTVWMHRVICSHCRNYFNQIAQVVDLTQSIELPSEAIDPEFREQLMTLFEEKRGSSDPEEPPKS